MTHIQKLEQEISNLPSHELAEFRAWFTEFDAKNWDIQFEQNVKSGKLDNLAKNAISDFKNGRFKKL